MHGLYTAFLQRFLSLVLLYVALGFVFAVLLAVVAPYQPPIVSYLTGGERTLSFLTPAEQSHMADVAAIVKHGMVLLLGCVIVLVLYLQYRPLSRSLARDSLLLSLALAVLLIPFQWTFTRFHAVLFPQGNWQFPLDSWLIVHFPPEFFVVMAICWIGATVFFLGALTRALPPQAD